MRLPLKLALFGLGVTGLRAPHPWEYQIELTNLCQLSCKMCLRDALEVPQIDMSAEVIDALVQNLKGVREFAIRGWGEPFLHPELFNILRRVRAADSRIATRITTSGKLLKGDRLQEVLKGDLDTLHISLDGLTDSQAGHPTDKGVADNLRALVKARGAKPRPILVFQTTMQPQGGEQVKEVVRLAFELGAELVNLVRLDVRLLEGVQRPDREEEQRIITEARREAAGRIPILAINQPSLPIRLATHFDRQCIRTLYQVYIDVEGNVLPCCKLRDMPMGNILKESVHSIWHSKRYRSFLADPSACEGCDAFFKGFRA